jgi:hypothetical protein
MSEPQATYDDLQGLVAVEREAAGHARNKAVYQHRRAQRAEADARQFAAALAGLVAANGHFLLCMGTPPGDLYPGEPCDDPACPPLRAAIDLARRRGYLPPKEEQG